MTFGVLEVARIPTVERRLRCLGDGTPSGSGLRHDGIDFCWRPHVVPIVNSVGDGACRASPVSAAMLQRPKGEFQAGLQIEGGNGAVLKFGADDPLCAPPQAIAIKRD